MVTTLSQLRSSDAWHASQEICYDAPTYIYAYFYGTRDIRCGKGAVSLRGMWQPYLPVILPLLFYSFYSHSAWLGSITSLRTSLMAPRWLKPRGKGEDMGETDWQNWSCVEMLFLVWFGEVFFSPPYILNNVIWEQPGLQIILGLGVRLTAPVQCEGPVLILAITKCHHYILTLHLILTPDQCTLSSLMLVESREKWILSGRSVLTGSLIYSSS